MRVMTFGAETGDFEIWTPSGGVVVDQLQPRKAAGGSGGFYDVQFNSVVAAEIQALMPINPHTGAPLVFREAYIRAPSYPQGAFPGGSQMQVEVASGGAGTVYAGYETTGPTQGGFVGGAALVTGAFGDITALRYNLVECHILTLAVNGKIEIKVDGVLKATFTGNTGNTTQNGIIVRGGDSWFDDFCVNVPAIQFSAPAGPAPTAGQTITGGTSGATIIVSDYWAGVDFYVFGYSWNGTPFQDGETISNGAGWSATLQAPSAAYVNGMSPQSSWPGDGYVVPTVPTANGTVQLTPSAGTNWQNVDTIPPNDGRYNSTDAPPKSDYYVMSSLPADTTQLNAVHITARVEKVGSDVNNAQLAFKDSSGSRTYEQSALPTSFGYITQEVVTQVNRTPLTPTSIEQAGIEMEA